MIASLRSVNRRQDNIMEDGLEDLDECLLMLTDGLWGGGPSIMCTHQARARHVTTGDDNTIIKLNPFAPAGAINSVIKRACIVYRR